MVAIPEKVSISIANSTSPACRPSKKISSPSASNPGIWKLNGKFASVANKGKDAFSREACFAKRFWLTFDFQPFPRKDPNLPAMLLPDDWSGYRARQLFLDYRQLLSNGMQEFIDQVLKGER